MTRDLGASGRRARSADAIGDSSEADFSAVFTRGSPPDPDSEWVDSVAEWRDDTAVPTTARQTLLKATGIEIPPPRFVLATAMWYLVALVPVNWLICRYGLRRPELAWLAAPVIIVAFSLGIVQLAEKNVGFAMTSREIDVVEAFAGYPRAHVTRFTCVYASSRRRCEFRYENPLAVAMPMSMGAVQRGQNIERVSLDFGSPVALGRYEVHPRSIGMVRAEETLTPLNLSVSQGGKPAGFYLRAGDSGGKWVLDNQTSWELWDCHLVTRAQRVFVGDIHPGEQLPLSGAAPVSEPSDVQPTGQSSVHRVRILDGPPEESEHSTVQELGQLQATDMLELLEREPFGSDAQLVGWMPTPVDGQTIDPRPGSDLGFTVFVVHLDVNP